MAPRVAMMAWTTTARFGGNNTATTLAHSRLQWAHLITRELPACMTAFGNCLNAHNGRNEGALLIDRFRPKLSMPLQESTCGGYDNCWRGYRREYQPSPPRAISAPRLHFPAQRDRWRTCRRNRISGLERTRRGPRLLPLSPWRSLGCAPTAAGRFRPWALQTPL
jgi:hypothetical protein